MIGEKTARVKLGELTLDVLGLKRLAELPPDQRKERMEDIYWVLEMLYCVRVCGGLPDMNWETVGKMTFPQYMAEAKGRG